MPSFLLMSIKNGFDEQWHCGKTDLRLVLHKGCQTTVTTVLSQIISPKRELNRNYSVIPKEDFGDYLSQKRINGDDFTQRRLRRRFQLSSLKRGESRQGFYTKKKSSILSEIPNKIFYSQICECGFQFTQQVSFGR